MKLKNEEDIIRLIQEDVWMIDILEAVKSLDLPDWWVCAGFVCSKIWDVLHGFTVRTPLPDIDIVYFDNSNIEEIEEKTLEEKLRNINGIQDIINLQLKPTPYFCETNERAKIYEDRIVKKNWKDRWSKINIVHVHRPFGYGVMIF
ncbi:nucleotidyltransferase family protein [Paenibacillus alkaliterrae]|uniref:nucleotidyltransferase family protein n=1 Tax=Paenibacillus alkaliterrae TaxID=320909 RepID=UPI001F2E2170|nr:nucleotidyltransferase family protein [Paenibacillus alkaliterrae]MCF2939571.1 nucleotidyltransferase family protein [Paenibacillus alkaliterrae]